MIYKLILNIKLYYYTFLDWLDDGPRTVKPGRQIEQSRQNVKLIRGVKKLISRLRSMSPESRTEIENLLSKESYKKTKTEIREEIMVRHKVLSNPMITTDDDLVKKVVKMAPMYYKEVEVRDVRKAITACLKAASLDPDNSIHSAEAKRLKARMSLLKGEIARAKNG